MAEGAKMERKERIKGKKVPSATQKGKEQS